MPTPLDSYRASHGDDLTVTRTAPIDRDGVDTAAGTFRAVLTTDAAIDSPLGPLVLSHTAGASDLPPDAPVLVGHDPGQLPVGRWSNFATRAGATRATATLATRHRDTLLRDIAEGVITDVSVGARVDLSAVVERDDGTLVAEAWTLREASLVGLGADPAAKIQRTEDDIMSKDTTAAPPADHPTRVSQIRELFSGLDSSEFTAIRIAALEDPSRSIDAIRSDVIAKLKETAATEAPGPGSTDEHTRAQVTTDEVDTFRTGFAKSLAFKTGLIDKADERSALTELRQGPFLSMSLYEVARDYLRRNNVPTEGLSREQLAHRALIYRAGDGFSGYGLGDLTELLASNVNMALAKGYDESDETWQMWTGRDQAPDFKQAHRPTMSAFSGLEQVYGSGEYTYGDFSDKEEVFTIGTWGRLFGITRRAIVNDSLAAFGRVPRAMGRAASRKVGDEVYSVINLTSTYTMNEDATALFTAGHGNYVGSGSGAAISVATLNTARTSMATQTDTQSVTTSIRPRYLITSEASMATAETIVAAAFNPATASGVDPMPGYIGRLVPVSDHRIDSDVSTAWYLAADPGAHDTVLVAFLDGISVPTLEQHDPDPSRDGVIFKVRHDFDCYAGDYRTLYANYGA